MLIQQGRGEIWDGVYRDNYSEDTYALIVDSVREIIDDVKPKNTFMPWTMPWIFPILQQLSPPDKGYRQKGSEYTLIL